MRKRKGKGRKFEKDEIEIPVSPSVLERMNGRNRPGRWMWGGGE